MPLKTSQVISFILGAAGALFLVKFLPIINGNSIGVTQVDDTPVKIVVQKTEIQVDEASKKKAIKPAINNPTSLPAEDFDKILMDSFIYHKEEATPNLEEQVSKLAIAIRDKNFANKPGVNSMNAKDFAEWFSYEYPHDPRLKLLTSPVELALSSKGTPERNVILIKGYNGSAWIITSLDVELMNDKKEKRIFRIKPVGSTSVENNTIFEAAGDAGMFSREGVTARFVSAQGFK